MWDENGVKESEAHFVLEKSDAGDWYSVQKDSYRWYDTGQKKWEQIMQIVKLKDGMPGSVIVSSKEWWPNGQLSSVYEAEPVYDSSGAYERMKTNYYKCWDENGNEKPCY